MNKIAIYTGNTEINNGGKLKRPSILFMLAVLTLLISVSVGATNTTTTSTSTTTIPSEITCSSCLDCTTKLNGDYNIVKLAADISEYSGTCITFGANNVEFDCNGCTIDGVDSTWYYGISMVGISGSIIRNCAITDFGYGIKLSNSDKNIVINSTITSNDGSGLAISSSDSNQIINNTINSNIGAESTSILLPITTHSPTTT